MSRLFLIIVCFFFQFNLSSQTLIFGKVVDSSGEELPSVTIIEMNTDNATLTDINGNFKLNVADSASVIISFVGKNDTILNAKDIEGKTIALTDEIYENKWVDFLNSLSALSVGYYGDIKYAPVGVYIDYLFYTKNRYLNQLFASSFFSYKTNFDLNHSFSFGFSYFDAIKFKKFKMSVYTSYEYKQVSISDQTSVTNDLYLLLSNDLTRNLQLTGGLTGRKERYDIEENHLGYYLGSLVHFNRIEQSVSGHIRFFGEYNEYGFSIGQRLSEKHRILSLFSIGLYYDK